MRVRRPWKTQEGSWTYPWLLPCFANERIPNVSGDRQQLVASPQNLNPRTKFGCIVESHESTRPRAELFQPKHHEDHIAGRGVTSVNHYNLVHKFIQMPTAIKIPDAKAAVDEEWKKHETIPAWKREKVRSKKEVILEAQRGKRSPLCFTDGHHLKNAELEQKLQKDKGRVVLRGDIMKDDSGAYSVFTEQGSLRKL